MLALSLNDWFKDEKNDEEEDNPLQDGHARFLAYVHRIGILAAKTASTSSRYIAYSSDFGEALRPLTSARFVNSMYVVAFAYVAADVGLSTYREHQRSNGDQSRTGRAFVETTTFQLVASILVPSLIIHTAVHTAQKQAKKTSIRFLKRYGPSALGLGIIPLLPFTIDSPIEHCIEELFETYWPVEGNYGGRPAGGHGAGEAHEKSE